jgi:hypothetical protein
MVDRVTDRVSDDVMRPLQLWLPSFGRSLAFPEVQRDAQRAYAEWNGEGTVWLLPELGEVMRWRESDDPCSSALAVPAEQVERVDVYHIGENGYVWGIGARERFPDGRVSGVLDSWLNLDVRNVQCKSAPQTISINCPAFIDGQLVYEKIEVQRDPGAFLPAVSVDEAERTVKYKWPPAGVSLKPISPEAESAAWHGSGSSEVPGAHFVLSWPAPFAELFPFGSGADDFFAQAKMVDIARRSTSGFDGAFQEAKDAAAIYLSEGWTTREFSWLWPSFAELGSPGLYPPLAVALDAVAQRGASFKLNDARNFQEALSSKAWREVMRERLSIRRVWGVTGLCWALFLEQFENSLHVRTCARCGRVIKGKRGKRFCNRQENERCFQDRAAERQRKSRAP